MARVANSPGYRDGWCIHYRYRSNDGKEVSACDAGVEYARFHGMKFAERPCFLDKGKPRPNSAPCEHLRLPTTEEIEAHEAWLTAHLEKMRLVMTGIKPWRTAHKNQSASEVVECPACKGRLHLSISGYNGHVHGRCETPDCVSWME